MPARLPRKRGREYECKHGVVGLLDTSGAYSIASVDPWRRSLRPGIVGQFRLGNLNRVVEIVRYFCHLDLLALAVQPPLRYICGLHALVA
jgi:hypothetical protein